MGLMGAFPLEAARRVQRVHGANEFDHRWAAATVLVPGH